MFFFVITHDDNIKLYFKNYLTFRPQGAFVSGYYIHIMHIQINSLKFYTLEHKHGLNTCVQVQFEHSVQAMFVFQCISDFN